jgi:hypothetical protein
MMRTERGKFEAKLNLRLTLEGGEEVVGVQCLGVLKLIVVKKES